MATTKKLIPRGKQFNTSVTRIGACDHVTLYKTTIAIRDNEKGIITLNTGGFDTPTTIRRMNECLNEWVGQYKMRVGKAHFSASNTRTIDIASATLIPLEKGV